MRIKEFIAHTLTKADEAVRKMKEPPETYTVDFDIGSDDGKTVNPDSVNRVKFTVQCKTPPEHQHRNRAEGGL